MINLDFYPKDISDISKLSAVFKADNFVLGLFDSRLNIIGHRSKLNAKDFNEVMSLYPRVPVSIAVKTLFFGHFQEVPQVQQDDFSKHVDKMTGQDIYCVYEAPFIPDGCICNHFSTTINHHYYLQKGNLVYIHFDKTRFHIYIQSDGLMLLYNSYDYINEDDVLFILKTIEESFPLDYCQFETLVGGYLEPSSKLLSFLQNFIPNLRMVAPRYSVVSANPDLKPYHYIDHIMNVLCV